ncbi:MAG TPA: PEGA domain-containing protein [Polyangiaceae bacterium]|jgi:hypothetical protein|nr:PEGA domain-containing protein [Polyangiaceae bacterium]
MRVAQRARRTHQVLAVFLSSFIAVGSVPWTAMAAPPKPTPAAKKPPAKPTKPEDDPKRGEARKKYAEGETKFAAGDFEGAYTAYKAANEAVPASQALFKMAVCLEKLDKPSEALTTYQAFLGSNPPPAMEPKVAEAQARVADLKKKIPVVVKVTSDPPGASVYVDGVVQMGTTPMEVKAPAGHHKVRVTSPGFDPYEKELEIEASATPPTIDAVLQKNIPIAEVAPPPPTPAEPKPAKPPELPPEKRSNVAAYVVLGVAGAGAIVGGIFGVKALQEKKDFDNGEKTTDKADSVEKNALIADMALAAALTLGLTGTVLLLTNSSTDTGSARAPRTAFEFTPVLTPQRAGAFATVRF